MQLPVAASGQAYRLRLGLAAGNPQGSNRVNIICGPWQAQVWVDGIPRTNEWTLPGEALTSRWATLCIDAEPWKPADTGSRDQRTLGVRWYGTEWEAIPPGGAP
jgi:hypothetical protein